MPEFEKLTETFTTDGLEEEEARDKAYLTILPKLRKDLQSIYVDRLLWIAQFKKDPIHKQIMKTKDAFVNDGKFHPEEALEVDLPQVNPEASECLAAAKLQKGL